MYNQYCMQLSLRQARRTPNIPSRISTCRVFKIFPGTMRRLDIAKIRRLSRSRDRPRMKRQIPRVFAVSQTSQEQDDAVNGGPVYDLNLGNKDTDLEDVESRSSDGDDDGADLENFIADADDDQNRGANDIDLRDDESRSSDGDDDGSDLDDFLVADDEFKELGSKTLDGDEYRNIISNFSKGQLGGGLPRFQFVIQRLRQ